MTVIRLIFFVGLFMVGLKPSFCEEGQGLIEKAHAYVKSGEVSRAIGVYYRPIGVSMEDLRHAKMLVEDAGMLFAKAVEEDKSDFVNVFSLGKFYYISDQFEEAKRWLDVAIELGKTDAGKFGVEVEVAKKIQRDIFFRELADTGKNIKDLFDLALEALHRNDMDKALNILDYIETSSGGMLPTSMLMDNDGKTFEPFNKALASLEEKVVINAQDAALHYSLGRLYRFKAVCKPVHFENDRKVGELESNALYQKATQELQRSIEISPDFVEAHYYLGKIYSMQREFNKAIPPLQRAIAGNPNRYQYYEYLGGLYGISGDFDRAYQNYDEALKRIDDWVDDPTGLILEKKKIDILKARIDKNGEGATALQNDLFAGSWNFESSKLTKLESLYLSTEEAAQVRSQTEEALKSFKPGDVGINIEQHGHQLTFMDRTGTFLGICYGRWFVLGLATMDMDKAAELVVRKEQFITGKIAEDGALEAQWLTEQKTIDPEKHPKLNFMFEQSFRAKRPE